MALPFTTVRHHSSSSVFLTDIIYSADFCYLVTAQEREARDNDTREGEHLFPSRVSLARNVLYWAHHDIDMILPSVCYAGYSISTIHWLCRRLKKQNIDPTINSTDSSILNRPCAVSFYIEDFRETWTRKFHHRDFCFLKSLDACVTPLTSLLNLERDRRLPSFGCLTDVYLLTPLTRKWYIMR